MTEWLSFHFKGVISDVLNQKTALGGTNIPNEASGDLVYLPYQLAVWPWESPQFLAAARLHSEGFALEDPACPFQLPHLATHWAQRRSLPLITCTLLHRSVNALLSLWLTWKTPSCFLDSASSLLTLDPFFLKKKKNFFYTWSILWHLSCFLSFSLAMLCGMWDLSSLTGDWTHAPCSRSAES